MEVLKANKLDTPRADPQTPVVIQSFSAGSLKALRNEHGCKLPLIFLFGSGSYSKEQLKAVKEFADGIAPNKAVIADHPEMVNDAR